RRIRPLFYLTPQALAESQILMDAKKLDAAIDVLNGSLETRERIYDGGFDGPAYRPHDLAQIYDRLGQAAALKGDNLQAIDYFEIVAAQGSDIPEALESVALYSLAELYRQSGRYERALSAIERGLAIEYDGSLPTPTRALWTGDWSVLKAQVLDQGGKALVN
ncbi:MAG: tetratricopeptide repeat protein, partial [Pseudomonadales bacterium]|nr:tetratricopeptide repeat protein [Pseudomonadales bacterium]